MPDFPDQYFTDSAPSADYPDTHYDSAGEGTVWGGGDPFDFYLPFLENTFTSSAGADEFAGAGAIFGTSGPSETVESSKSGASGVDKSAGSGLMARIRNAFGFPDTEKGNIEAGRAATTLVGAGIMGAAKGYGANEANKLEKAKMAQNKGLLDSQIALNKSRTNQVGLDKLKFTQAPGMVNAPWKPTPFIPVKDRETA